MTVSQDYCQDFVSSPDKILSGLLTTVRLDVVHLMKKKKKKARCILGNDLTCSWGQRTCPLKTWVEFDFPHMKTLKLQMDLGKWFGNLSVVDACANKCLKFIIFLIKQFYIKVHLNAHFRDCAYM